MAVLKFRLQYKEEKRFILLHPDGGAIEENLSTPEVTYRYRHIKGLSKMLFRVEGDTIYIVDFWDTRKEPPTKID